MYKVESLCEQLEKQGVYVGSGSQSAALVRSSKQSDITKGTCKDGFMGRGFISGRQESVLCLVQLCVKYRLVSAMSIDI